MCYNGLMNERISFGFVLLALAGASYIVIFDPLKIDPFAPYNVERFITPEEEARLQAEEKACVERKDAVHITMHLKGSTYNNPRWICMPLELYNVHKRKDK